MFFSSQTNLGFTSRITANVAVGIGFLGDALSIKK